MINGIEFYRRKLRISARELSKRSKVSITVLSRLLHEGLSKNTPLYYYDRLANVLGVPIDDLLAEYDEAWLEPGDRTPYPSRTGSPNNCIAVYRLEKGLSLEQLGFRLGGLTRERARQICAAPIAPQKHIDTIATYEGVSPAEFRRRHQSDWLRQAESDKLFDA